MERKINVFKNYFYDFLNSLTAQEADKVFFCFGYFKNST